MAKQAFLEYQVRDGAGGEVSRGKADQLDFVRPGNRRPPEQYRRFRGVWLLPYEIGTGSEAVIRYYAAPAYEPAEPDRVAEIGEIRGECVQVDSYDEVRRHLRQRIRAYERGRLPDIDDFATVFVGRSVMGERRRALLEGVTGMENG